MRRIVYNKKNKRPNPEIFHDSHFQDHYDLRRYCLLSALHITLVHNSIFHVQEWIFLIVNFHLTL